ncbi:Hypothetical predicted protein, partial [Paramuricea clavata]
VKGTKWIQEERQREFILQADTHHNASEIYFHTIPQEHVKSARKWMKDGIFQRNQMPAFAENPTLTGYDNSYSIPSDAVPFAGWDYIEVKKFGHSNSLVTMYGAYIENILGMVMRKLSSKQVRFQILLSDCMDIKQYIDQESKYDRILTSNLIDYIILPDLLKLCSQKLNHGNPYATIVTETQNWTRDFCPEADVTGDSERYKLGKETALKDTKNPQQVQYGDVREYLDNSREFIDFIRALFHTHAMRIRPTELPKIPTVQVLGNEFQLKLRDGFRNENRIATFKMAVNRRRVTVITGLARIIEWVPWQSE